MGRRAFRSGLVAFIAGVVFAIGLAISGMTHPRKIIGFLDPTPHEGASDWDPSLAFVMVGAIGVGAVAFRFILRRPRPVFADRFADPSSSAIDAPLVIGAALFGLGWGLGGFCPGPAVVSLVTGAQPVLVFVAAMLAGMGLHNLFNSFARSSKPTENVALGRNQANETGVSR